jgi:hypothetical protein
MCYETLGSATAENIFINLVAVDYKRNTFTIQFSLTDEKHHLLGYSAM